MGTRGPVPAPSDQRRRRNKPETPTERVDVLGETTEAPVAADWWHPTAALWYASLPKSGQSRFYEPSDWVNAHFCAGLMSQALTDDKVNAQLIAQIRGLMTDLLVTEGARRRVGMEIVRKPIEAETRGGNVTAMGDRRKRLSDAS